MGGGPGGDAEKVPADRGAVFDQHPTFGEAQVDHAPSELEVDVELAVLRLGPQRQPFSRDLAEEIVLAQVRTLVGELWLGADQRDATQKGAVAQAGRNRVAGRAGADDYCFDSSSL